jgi:hypothetical protein
LNFNTANEEFKIVYEEGLSWNSTAITNVT